MATLHASASSPELQPAWAWRWLAGALGLALWLAWSLLVARSTALGFRFTPNQLAWLAALPALAMACARVLAGVLPPRLAGSQWSCWAAAALLPLAVALGFVAERAETPYEVWVLLALGCGSGAALFVAALAPFGAPLSQQASVLARRGAPHLAWLAVGSFGSLVGWIAALPWLAVWHGVALPDAPAAVALVAWALLWHALGTWGPARGGAARTRRVVQSAFVALIGGTGALAWLLASPPAAATFGAVAAALVTAAALAGGATLQLVRQLSADDSRAALGLVTSLGAFGGFVLPKALGTAIALTGGAGAALALFALFYLSCLLCTRSLASRTPCSSSHRPDVPTP
jgi:nitrate/nitrite transporter NarK